MSNGGQTNFPNNGTLRVVERIEAQEFAEERGTEAKLNLFMFLKKQEQQLQTMLGYPFTESDDAKEIGAALQKVGLNNAGNPFGSLHTRNHSHRFEVAVVKWFAELYDLNAKDAWGYVTSGGTESIIQAFYTAREIFPTGILYASTESHHSVFKAARLLRMELKKIPTNANGEMDYEELEKALIKNKEAPAIINATTGTTFYGACDNVKKIVDALRKCDYSENEFYIHCDAALSGLLVPFLRGGDEGAVISFNLPISSVCVSCHKFLGVPMPCGVLLMRKASTNIHGDSIPYLANSLDLTLSCSRNGHTPIYIWYILCKRGRDGIKQEALKCVANAQLLKNTLCCAGVHAVLHPNSVIVVFPRPCEKIVHKWQLACQGDKAHVVVMPHCTPRILNSFVVDFLKH